jgi:phage head maturation protease
MTAKTGEASTVHEPIGKPSGPGLWHHKGMQLPPYVQHVAHHLIAQGHDESRAIEMAVGIVKNWAAGHDGHGNAVHPDVQAAAAKNVAQWEALKAKASGRSAVADTKAPYGDVLYGDPGYLDRDGNQASKSGKPGVKRYPLTADKVMAAWSYINQEKNAAQYTPDQLKAIRGRIQAAMAKHGHEVSSDSGDSGDSGRADSIASYTRSFPLEDVSVRTTRDGRIVEAYLAVFNSRSKPIHDQDGDYTEDLDPVTFNKAISDAAPQGTRRNWLTGVFYNHARTLYGTPSEMFSIPVAVTQDLQADGGGVRATDKYHRSQLADEIVEALESGAIPGYSFQGRFLRSAPLIPRGGFKKNHRTGELPHVRRLESTLKEYGPTPFPAYADAAVLGLRSDSLMAAMLQDPELAQRMLRMLSGGTPAEQEPLPEFGTPPDEEPPPRSRLVHSGRSLKQEMQAERSAFLQRYRR